MSLNGSPEAPATELVQIPPNWRHWISQTRVCTRLELNPRQLDKLVKDGKLPEGKRMPDATLRWDPDLIEALEAGLTDGVELNEDGSETLARGKATRDMSVGLAKLVAQATQHAERSFVNHERATHNAIETLRGINRDLRSDNDQLREEIRRRDEKHLEVVKQLEGLASEQAARQIAQNESQASQARKSKMFDLVMQRAPGLLGKLTKSLGLDEGEDMVKVKAVIELAEDLDPALLELLASQGALSTKQVGLVETIIGKKLAAAPAAVPNEGKETETNAATESERSAASNPPGQDPDSGTAPGPR